jgi:hypothetical protein
MEQSMSITQDLWSAKLPNGDVRSGTLEQLNEAFRSGHLGESTMVRASRSDHWIKLTDALGGAAPVSGVPTQRASAPPPSAATSPGVNGSSELWQVKLANGEVRSGTRQQLVEAFRAGHLDEQMPVLAAGMHEWMPLGTLMRRSEPPPTPLAPLPASPPPPPPVTVQQVSSPPPSTATSPSPSMEGLWQVRLGDGQVRSGTQQQLEEAFRAGHLGQDTLVLAAGAREWVTLASVANRISSAPPPHSASEVQSEVQEEPKAVEAQPAAPAVTSEQPPMTPEEETPAPFAPDASPPQEAPDVPADLQAAGDRDPLWQVQLTVKQLEEALRAGLLGDDALVLAAGTDQWVRLGEVLPHAPWGESRAVAESLPEPASQTEPWPASPLQSTASD